MKSLLNSKLKINLLILFLIFTFNIPAKVVLNNGDVAFGTWTKAHSPYILSGKIIVPEGKTLNIEKGTIIKCKSGSNNDLSSAKFNSTILQVKGVLNALGEQDEKVLFTSTDRKTPWGLILFENTKQASTLDYCIIENSNPISGYSDYKLLKGSITILNGVKVKIYNCEIKENIVGIQVFKTKGNNLPHIYYNRFSDNEISAIMCFGSSSPVIERNIIEKSETGILCLRYSEPVIKNNIIRNVEDGILCYLNSNASISNNFLEATNTGIVLLEKNTVEMNNNIITNSKFGISVQNESSVLLQNSVISKIQVSGLKLNNRSNAYIHNSIIWNEVPEFWFNDENSRVTLQYSLVKNSYQPSQVIKLEGNIFDKNPGFIGSDYNNFHLLCNALDMQNFSPCIDGGNPCLNCCDAQLKPNSGLWTKINDIGAYGGPLNSSWNLPEKIINTSNSGMLNLTYLYGNK